MPHPAFLSALCFASGHIAATCNINTDQRGYLDYSARSEPPTKTPHGRGLLGIDRHWTAKLAGFVKLPEGAPDPPSTQQACSEMSTFVSTRQQKREHPMSLGLSLLHEVTLSSYEGRAAKLVKSWESSAWPRPRTGLTMSIPSFPRLPGSNS